MARVEFSNNRDVVYFIDEDKKVVVAKYVVKPPFVKVLNLFKDIFSSVSVTEFFEKRFDCPTCFVGKAKCSPGDTFDVEVGKKLARSRAFEKYYVAAAQCTDKLLKYFSTKRDEIESISNTFDAILENMHQSVQTMLETL